MSVEHQVREAASPNFGLLRRFSRPMGKSSPDGSTDGINAFRGVAANSSTSSESLTARTKTTAFSRIKAQLGKRRKNGRDALNDNSPTQEPDDTTPNALIPEPPLNEAPELTSAINSPSHDGNEELEEAGGGTSGLNQAVIRESGNLGSDDSLHTTSTATLARRIHSLLSSLPPFYTLSNSGDPKALDSVSSDPKIGPNFADSKLLSLLSSPSVMNGSISKGTESVWAILERLKYSPGRRSEGQRKSEDESGISNSDDNVEVSSVMICCPLQPTDETEVELARSEVVSVDIEETALEPVEGPKPLTMEAGINLWPFGKGKGKKKLEATPTPETPPSPPKLKEVRVWYPSRTKVSLQAAWWGYRIYLPPPVMRVLNDKTLEAAKRTAMITAALTWLITHIPTSMLPPQLGAVIGIVKGIVPIIGYVGGFIAWSWSTIQSFDKGQGVILSATWLLPIALIPGTWNYTEPPPSNVAGNENFSPGINLPPSPPPKDPSAQRTRR